MAVRRPRRDGIEPGTSSSGNKSSGKKSSGNKSSNKTKPPVSRQKPKTPTTKPPVIAGRPANDRLKSQGTTPAERERTAPAKKSPPGYKEKPFRGGVTPPRSKKGLPGYANSIYAKGTDRWQMTPAEKEKAKPKSGNARSGGGGTKYTRR